MRKKRIHVQDAIDLLILHCWQLYFKNPEIFLCTLPGQREFEFWLAFCPTMRAAYASRTGYRMPMKSSTKLENNACASYRFVVYHIPTLGFVACSVYFCDHCSLTMIVRRLHSLQQHLVTCSVQSVRPSAVLQFQRCSTHRIPKDCAEGALFCKEYIIG
jgi:hypothetical protein